MGIDHFFWGYWLWAIGYGLLVIGYGLLAMGYWLWVIGYGLLDIGYWLFLSAEEDTTVAVTKEAEVVRKSIVVNGMPIASHESTDQ